jgi:hypothetical protein
MEKLLMSFFAVVLLLVEALVCKDGAWQRAQSAYSGMGGTFGQIHAIAKSK